eukprot:TRINITY_DN824_c0_g2_i14.p1 TRINITY_DN824_c0_g2~~TRINITY_DN824_c0_g2_i14.p1  ORF type:complete len:140 (-),score=18.80 TRINITY_DN824_c0_g2_i14:730-1149(-)
MAMDIVRRKDLLSEYDEATFQSSSCPQPSSRWICESPTRPSTNTQRSTKPFIIGITGGSASGKTSCCTTVVENLRNERVAVISLDSYYKTLNSEEIRQVKEQSYNFGEKLRRFQRVTIVDGDEGIKVIGKDTVIVFFSS